MSVSKSSTIRNIQKHTEFTTCYFCKIHYLLLEKFVTCHHKKNFLLNSLRTRGTFGEFLFNFETYTEYPSLTASCLVIFWKWINRRTSKSIPGLQVRSRVFCKQRTYISQKTLNYKGCSKPLSQGFSSTVFLKRNYFC